MKELEQYQKTEAYKVFSRKTQDRQKGKSHRQGIRTRTKCICSLFCMMECHKAKYQSENIKDIFLSFLYYTTFTYKHHLGILLKSHCSHLEISVGVPYPVSTIWLVLQDAFSCLCFFFYFQFSHFSTSKQICLLHYITALL